MNWLLYNTFLLKQLKLFIQHTELQPPKTQEDLSISYLKRTEEASDSDKTSPKEDDEEKSSESNIKFNHC